MTRVLLPCLLALSLVAFTSGVSAENVARAQFTSSISDREPVDHLDPIPGDRDEVTFFTELRNLEGRTIRHRWLHAGEAQAEVSFRVGGPRWRVWSNKQLLPDWHGDWGVEVVDEDGSVLGYWRVRYGD